MQCKLCVAYERRQDDETKISNTKKLQNKDPRTAGTYKKLALEDEVQLVNQTLIVAKSHQQNHLVI